MLKPDRHTNPDLSVINISAFILQQVKSQYSIDYDKLLEKVIKKMGESAKENSKPPSQRTPHVSRSLRRSVRVV